MKTHNSIPIIKVKARDHYSFGFQIGRQLRHEIQARIRENKKIYRELFKKNFKQLIPYAHKFLPQTEKYFPHYLTEAQAMSEGARVPFRELFVIICEEELAHDKSIPRCTSIALKLRKHEALLAHNEDWLPSYRDNGLALIHGTFKGRSFLALTFMASMVGSSCAVTDRGFCYATNSIDFKKFSHGIPRPFILRALLDVKKHDEVIKILDLCQQGLGGNFMFAWADGVIGDVEEFGQRHTVFRDKQFLAHTNHPLHKKNQNRNNTYKSSVARYKQVRALLRTQKTFSVPFVKRVLSEHKAGICAHEENRRSLYGATIASVVMNPKKGWMDVCAGNPCQNHYQRFTLN
ncbi:MAG TPA: hypothetical protein DDW36_00805 [Candidatus Magasanikbacteria bacterium]|nr:hypothetical protein [Candidatus Magasanikbacteria bacterium]